MKHPPARLILLLALIGSLLGASPGRAAVDRAIEVSNDDQEMNRAIAQARAKLPHFWRIMAAPKNGENEFCLKVRIVEGDNVEYFWCTELKIEKGTVTGVIGNDPVLVQAVKLGQRIPIRETDISDWLYIREEKMIGNYTVRPLMKSMSPDELEFLKAKLGELPKD